MERSLGTQYVYGWFGGNTAGYRVPFYRYWRFS
jgi:hypothetical protein